MATTGMAISLISSGAPVLYCPAKAGPAPPNSYVKDWLSRSFQPEIGVLLLGIKRNCSQKKLNFNKRGVCSALPQTGVSIVVAAVAVGVAATLLTRTTKTSVSDNSSLKTCEDCGGSGICPICKGEGFILKKLSDESADRARMAAKTAATRYTAGLPKKWSYCFKCNSSRSCVTCRGSGLIDL